MPTQNRVRPKKTSELVAERIVADITRDGLRPGDVLPQEVPMQAHYGVGRSTLRQALHLLETQGLLDLKAGRGPVVRQPMPSDLVNSLTLLLQFQGATFETLLRARVMFEPAIAAEAADRATDDDIAALRVCVAHSRRGSTDEDLLAADLEFHRLIIATCHNPVASAMLEALISVLRMDLDLPQQRAQHDPDVHEAIVAALESGDSAAAETLMRAHMHDVMTSAQRFPMLLTRPVRWQ